VPRRAATIDIDNHINNVGWSFDSCRVGVDQASLRI